MEGTVDAIPAVFESHPDLMFFFVDQTHHFFALGGSAHHVIGNVRSEKATASPSHAGWLLKTLEIAVRDNPHQYDAGENELSRALHMGIASSGTASPWTKLLQEVSMQFGRIPRQKISFLARRLVSEEWEPDSKRYTLASPLYVTLADA